jgi:hypothetical protein
MMTEREKILIAARVAALKHLARDAGEAYKKALAASGLPEQHFKLRAMLLGILPTPPRKGE